MYKITSGLPLRPRWPLLVPGTGPQPPADEGQGHTPPCGHPSCCGTSPRGTDDCPQMLPSQTLHASRNGETVSLPTKMLYAPDT